MERETDTIYNRFVTIQVSLVSKFSYHICLAIYDIPIEPVTYTVSEDIDITNNQISLDFLIEIIGEIVMHPRSGGVYFEMYAGTSGFACSQH